MTDNSVSAILLITIDFVKHLKIKSNAIKTWRFIDDMSPSSNANETCKIADRLGV